jgi:hypothetical protein
MSADLKVYTEPMKAETLSSGQMEKWLEGKRSRRILVVPFTGPLPGGKAGLDLDGEYFDEDTDLVGAFPILRRTRERIVDWHHDDDPTRRMKGAIIGRIHLDDTPEGDGLWADFWANAGERRRALMAQLEARGVPLYGSSQSAGKASVVVEDDGRIAVWPLIRHTITTSPQNTHAVVPPLKALLDGDNPYDALTVAAFQAAMAGANLSPLQPLVSDDRRGAGKAGLDPKARLETALDLLAAQLRQGTT